MGFERPRGGHPGQRMGTDLAAAEFRRLGKPGAYRLGQLRAQGVSVRRPPAPLRARLARQRRNHRWPAPVWLIGLLACVAAIAAATAVGWTFAPLLAGLGAGVANRAGGWPPRIALPAVAGMAAVGWILPFLLRRVSGDGLTHAVGALTGLPGDAAGVIALTGLLAVIQALAGYWVISAITPRLLDDQIR